MKTHRYARHGAQIDLEPVTVLMGSDRKLISVYSSQGKVQYSWDRPKSPMERIWHIRVNGKRIDTALTYLKARQRAEAAARKELVR